MKKVYRDDLKEGVPVVYLPFHLQYKEIKDDQLGVISSWNNLYIFIKYKGINSQATKMENLYLIEDQPKLLERLQILIEHYGKKEEIG